MPTGGVRPGEGKRVGSGPREGRQPIAWPRMAPVAREIVARMLNNNGARWRCSRRRAYRRTAQRMLGEAADTLLVLFAMVLVSSAQSANAAAFSEIRPFSALPAFGHGPLACRIARQTARHRRMAPDARQWRAPPRHPGL